nr:transporter substrate-binding domain-containing protein [uncultured Caproiciproducens sp.]
MAFKKSSVVLSVLLSVCFLFTACTSGQGAQSSADKKEDSLQRVLTAGKLTVVGSGGYPPFNYIDDGGNVVGFDVDVGKEIAKRMDVKLDYVTGEWSGLVEGLRSGRYDGILGSMAITDERLQSVNFTIPYYYSGAQLVVRNDSKVKDAGEMKGKTIAVATGTNYEQDAKSLGAKTSLYDDDNSTMLELISGRVDGVITDRLVALGAIEKMEKGKDLTLSGNILRLEKMGIAINKSDTALLDKMNEIVQKMHDDGTLTTISKKWHNGADITIK